MKTKIIFSFLCSIFLLQNFSFSQNFLDHTFFTLGFALSEQDRRLFEFPGAEGVLERENNKLDYEYNFTLQKSIIKLNLFQINAGIGYAEYNSTFSRPFSHRALNSGVTKELRYIKRYAINKLIFPISTNLFLTKKQNVFLNFNALPAIAFRKSAKDLSFEKRETKWELKFNSLELYPGLGIKLNPRTSINAYYRWIYINKLDEVIFNEILFPQGNFEFIEKEYDSYNPFKIWLTVNYALHP